MRLYTHTTGVLKGRKYLAITTPDKKRTTKLYSRHLMEESIGRLLGRDEHVDHVDGDCTNDTIANLQVLSNSEHGKKTAKQLGRGIELCAGVCPVCQMEFTRPAKDVRSNKKRGNSGPYCSRSCAGKATYKNPWKKEVL